MDHLGSVSVLAEASGVGARTLGDWLRGVREPRPAKIRQLCNRLGMDPTTLLGKEGPAIITVGELVWGNPEPTKATFQIESLDGRESLASIYSSWLASRHGIDGKQEVILLHALEDLPNGEILKDEPVLFRKVGKQVNQPAYKPIVGEIVLVVGESQDYLWIDRIAPGKALPGEIIGTAFWTGRTINRRRRPK